MLSERLKRGIEGSGKFLCIMPEEGHNCEEVLEQLNYAMELKKEIILYFMPGREDAYVLPDFRYGIYPARYV